MMMAKTVKFFFIILLLLPLSCGFKVINKSEAKKFSITNVVSTGDKRIGYKIKNYLLAYSEKDSQNEIIVNFNINKNKSIKEKNIKNEITKYQISLQVNLKFYKLDNTENQKEINLKIDGNYTVDQIYSRTKSNEKKLIENLTDNISGKLLDEIGIRLNDI